MYCILYNLSMPRIKFLTIINEKVFRHVKRLPNGSLVKKYRIMIVKKSKKRFCTSLNSDFKKYFEYFFINKDYLYVIIFLHLAALD